MYLNLFWFLFFNSFSLIPLIYQNETNRTVVSCSPDSSGEVIIPQIVSEIYSKSSSSSAFQNCQYSIITLRFEENSQIKSISSRSFAYSTLQTADFSECKLLEIFKDDLFYGCYNLSSVILPPNISTIGSWCFCQCTSLTSITIPKFVKEIREQAFSGCVNLKSFTLLSNMNIIRFDSNEFSNITTPMNIFIPGNLNTIISSKEYFPNASSLYIGSQTILSNSTKAFFGKKRMIVYMSNTSAIEDNITNKVIDYIALEKYIFVEGKSKEDFIYHKVKCLSLINLAPRNRVFRR